MKTKDEMIERYNMLYGKMKDSKDAKMMKIFFDTEKFIFKAVATSHQEMAENWLSHLEAVCWEQYICEREAMNISKRIVNQDGTKGFHWQNEPFRKVVETHGGLVEDSPYYNAFALLVTANMVYSDHANSISDDMGYKSPSEVPNERMLMSCYKKALEKLKDVDGGYIVRKYFNGKMYDDSPI